jgi:hypothetical protein
VCFRLHGFLNALVDSSGLGAELEFLTSVPVLLGQVRLVSMDRDAAVHSPELKRWAALADVGVDGITNLALDGDREADRDAAVYGLCHQVCGVIIWSLHGDAAVRRLREEAPSLPLRSVKLHLQAAIDGTGVYLSPQGIEGETSVRRISINHSIDVCKLNATVVGV